MRGKYISKKKQRKIPGVWCNHAETARVKIIDGPRYQRRMETEYEDLVLFAELHEVQEEPTTKIETLKRQAYTHLGR